MRRPPTAAQARTRAEAGQRKGQARSQETAAVLTIRTSTRARGVVSNRGSGDTHRAAGRRTCGPLRRVPRALSPEGGLAAVPAGAAQDGMLTLMARAEAVLIG